MPDLPDSLADGVIPTAEGLLLACPTGERRLVRTGTFANTTLADAKFTLFVKRSGGSSRQISPLEKVLDPGASVTLKEMGIEVVYLSSEDEMRGLGDTLNAIQFYLGGVKITP